MYRNIRIRFYLCVPLDFLVNWLMSFFSGIRPNWQRVAGDSAARPARKLRLSAGRRQQTTAIKSGRHSSSSKVFKKSRPSFQWCDMTSPKMLIVDIASSNHFPRPDTYFMQPREPDQHWPSHQKRKNKSSSISIQGFVDIDIHGMELKKEECLIIPCRFATDQWQRHPRNDGLRNWEKPTTTTATATSDRWAIGAWHARAGGLTRNAWCVTSETRKEPYRRTCKFQLCVCAWAPKTTER